MGHEDEAPVRRQRLTQQVTASTGIDEEMIERLVRAFYGRIRVDPVLGPIFAQRVEDWEQHIARLCLFWSSVALMSGAYRGQPVQRHLGLGIDGTHFTRWLAMFEATAADICPPVAAEHFITRARRIAATLQVAVETQGGGS